MITLNGLLAPVLYRTWVFFFKSMDIITDIAEIKLMIWPEESCAVIGLDISIYKKKNVRWWVLTAAALILKSV